MRIRLQAAFALALLFPCVVARADSFLYDFSNSVFDDTFTYVSPVLFTADAQFQADTCAISGIARTCTVSLVLSNNALAITYPIGNTMGGAAFDSLDPDFFMLGTHTTRDSTLSITQVSTLTPEPSSLVLLGTGALAVLGMSRRRYAL